MASAELMPSLNIVSSIIDETRGSGCIDNYRHQETGHGGVDLPIITRHLLTIACLIGTEAKLELEWHIRKALRDGCPVGEIKQALLLLAIYCDTPAAVSALKSAEEIVDMWADKPRKD